MSSRRRVARSINCSSVISREFEGSALAKAWLAFSQSRRRARTLSRAEEAEPCGVSVFMPQSCGETSYTSSLVLRLELFGFSNQRPQALQLIVVLHQGRCFGGRFVPNRFGDGVSYGSTSEYPSRG